MEHKEQLNQNPEEAKVVAQEENPVVSNETEQVSDDQPNVKAEIAEDEKKEETIVEPAKEEVVETAADVVVANEETVLDAPAEAEVVETAKEEVASEVPDAEDTKSEDHEDHEDHDEEEDDHEEEVTEETYARHTIDELVTEFESIVESEKIAKSKNRVGLIRLFFGKKIKEIKEKVENDFLEAGGVKEEYKPESVEVEDRFNRAFGKYKSLRRKYRVEQEKQKVENLAKKNELLEEMRALVASDEKLKDTYDKFNEIQTRWREIGMVPQGDVQLLWNNYHFLVEKFFDRVKINKELRDLDLKKNLESKIALCEKVEELLIEESINKSFKALQEYHNEWKAIGPVPSTHNEEVWERFKTASDKINERRKAHYDELQTKLEENYTAKQALCVKAEELFLKPIETTKEWQKRTEEFEELLKVWKTFGPAPRKVNDEIWANFRGWFNNFYEAKKEYFAKIKDGQQENYHKKLDILNQAEALSASTDWGDATKGLINLQKEWKKIGPVPRKHSDEIWKKFRAANDAFFAAKADHFKGQVEEETTNLTKKKELVAEIKNAEYSEDKKENLEMIKTFQRRWSQIGNVPRKEMDKLYKDYRAAVDEQLAVFDFHPTEACFAGNGFNHVSLAIFQSKRERV